MTQEEIQQAIASTQAGANVWLEWERPCKLRKAYGTMPLTKKTRMLCRIGVRYDNIGEVQQGRQDGSLPAENAGLKGFEWDQYPFLLKHNRNGKLYLRCESATFKSKTTKAYYLDGQEVEFEDYKHCMLASEMPKEKTGHLTFNVCIEFLLAVHKSNEPAEAVEEAQAEPANN